MKIENEDLLWTYEVVPELYSKSPKASYQIRKTNYGLYSKKDAEIICEFLRKNLANIIYDIANPF